MTNQIDINEKKIPDSDRDMMLSDENRAELAMQKTENPDLSSQIPTRYLKYMQKDGPGPWTGEINHSVDNTENWKLQENDCYINSPDVNSKDLINTAYYRVYDQNAYFLGQKYNFDFCCTRGMLTFEDLHPDLAKDKINEINSGMIKSNDVMKAFLSQMDRIHRTAIELKDSDTLDSLTFMHNLAKDGKKIAIVDCHGCTGFAKDGSQILLVEALNGEAVIPADLVLIALSRKLDKSEYGAILMGACNPDAIPVDMENIDIPVISSMAINRYESNPTKIHWPKDEESLITNQTEQSS